MENRKPKKMISVFAGLLFLTGCSVADYAKPVADLKTGIDASAKVIEAIDREAVKKSNLKWRELISDQKATLSLASGACAHGTSSCSLTVRLLEKGKPNVGFPEKPMVGVPGLKKYVSNLQAIVNAETVSAITTSANAAIASAVEIQADIEKATGEKSGGSIKAYSEPVSAMIKWLVTQYVEREKYKALAAATKKAQPVIDAMMLYHQTKTEVVMTLKITNGTGVFLKAEKAFFAADDAQKVDDSVINKRIAAANSYDALLKGAAAHPLKAFGKAHRALHDNLNNNASLSDALAAIKSFKSKADDFTIILTQFEKVAKEQEKK